MKKFLFSASVMLSFFGVSAQIAPNSRLRFTENKNQWPANIQYRADLPGGKLFLENNSFTYLFYDTRKLAAMHDHEHAQDNKNKEEHSSITKLHAFKVSLLNSNPQSFIHHDSRTGELRNYFIGKDPARWASDVESFSKISYEGIYPYTTLELYEDNNRLKYQYIINAGGNANAIQIKYEGVDSIYISDGRLIIKTSLNTITEEAPYSYQIINEKKIFVPSAFSLADNTVHFSFPNGFDPNYDLIIDPQLIFSTYSGSYADNWGNTATFDQAGNLYSGGSVFDVGFPSTLGAFQVSYAGPSGYSNYGVGIDVGILKYNSTGTALLYATYLGGFSSEIPHSLVVNENDELLIFGSTSSINFPTTLNSFDRTFNGGNAGYPFGPYDAVYYANGSDIFISKLNSTGSVLLASTYLGGSQDDGILYQFGPLTKNYGDQFRGEIITDKTNNVYIASGTRSANFPFINGFHSFGNGNDAVVVKMNPDLSSVIWSNFLGGTGEDVAFCIALDSMNNVFVGGGTTSYNFPTMSNSIMSSASGSGDGFVTAIDKSGTSLLSSTYLGTTSYDQVYFLQLDAQENVYALGQTSGAYPETAGVYSNPNSGQFIHKMSRNLDATIFSTVIGNKTGHPNLSPSVFLVNDCGNIFLAGWGGAVNSSIDYYGLATGYIGGNTNGLTITPDAYQNSTDGSDFYIMALEKGAKSLLYATYIGGNSYIGDHVDGGTSRFDKKGIIYHSVCAGCGGTSAFPTTPGVWSNTNNSNNCNNAAFKFDLATLKAIFTADTTKGCGPLPVNFANNSIGGKSFTWDFGDGTSQSTTSPSSINHTYAGAGTYRIRLVATDLTTCIVRDTAVESINVYKINNAGVSSSYVICPGDSAQLDAGSDPFHKYSWSPANSLSDSSTYNPYAKPATNTIYKTTIVDTNNCSIIITDTVLISEIVKGSTLAKNITDCSGLPKIAFSNGSIGPLNYVWDFGDGQTSSEQNPTHQFSNFGSYNVVVKIYNSSCSDTDTLHLAIPEIKIPNLITPNGDNLNDKYVIEGNPGEWHFDVYNRWGAAVYKNENYANDWDAGELHTGLYYYLITTHAGVQCKGWVHVIK